MLTLTDVLLPHENTAGVIVVAFDFDFSAMTYVVAGRHFSIFFGGKNNASSSYAFSMERELSPRGPQRLSIVCGVW